MRPAKAAKRLVEGLTGLDIVRCGPRAFNLVDRKRPEDSWLSYPVLLRSVLRDLRIDLVLDVGANEGQYGRELRELYSGDILSFEPVSTVFAALERTAAGDPRWKALPLALGSAPSTATIHVSARTTFSSLLETNAYGAERFGARAAGTREETVTVRRLDEVLAAEVPDLERRRIFLKMDTQGYDPEVFRGLGERRRHVAALQSEVSVVPIYENMPHWTESVLLYEEAGFGIAGMFPVQRDAHRVIEFDCVMVRIER